MLGEQVRRRSRVRVLMVRTCKRVHVDVGLCHQKESEACLIRSEVGHAAGLACCARLCLPDAGGVKPHIRGSRS